jgi:hypothetical protein
MPGPLLDDDAHFDARYPKPIWILSRRFWTPVSVARRAAELLRAAGARRVLDVGAGAGKFVLVAAACAPELEFVGFEHRPHLVQVARRMCEQLGIPNARVDVADATTASWAGFDAFYFFNPFAENVYVAGDCIDDRVELTAERLTGDIRRVEKKLARAPVGTVVVTYHGATGPIPASYDLEAAERAGSDWLRVWAKRRDIDNGAFFLEMDDGAVCRSARAT